MFLTQSIFKNYNKFYFSKRGNLAKVYLKFTYSNIIISLTDYKDKLIACHTSGSSGVVGTRRRKTAPQAIEIIVKKLFPYFILFKIKTVELILRQRVNSATHYLIKELSYYGLRISALRRRTIIAHNGVRGRKIPRK